MEHRPAEEGCRGCEQELQLGCADGNGKSLPQVSKEAAPLEGEDGLLAGDGGASARARARAVAAAAISVALRLIAALRAAKEVAAASGPMPV